MKKLLILIPLILINSCKHFDKIEVKGEVSGTRYSNEQFVKGKHTITAKYPISEIINIKGSVSHEYKTGPLMQTELPDYGETSLEILF